MARQKKIEDIETQDITEELEDRAEAAKKILKLDLDLLSKEIEQGYREVEYKDKSYFIHFPTTNEETELSKFKSKTTSALLRDPDIMLSDEILESLRKRQVWDAEKGLKESELQKKLGESWGMLLTEQAKDNPNEDKVMELTKQRMLLQLDLDMLAGSKKELLNYSLESQVESKVNLYKVYLCTKDNEGNKVFNTFDDFSNADRVLQNTLLTEGLTFWSGMNRAMFELALSTKL